MTIKSDIDVQEYGNLIQAALNAKLTTEDSTYNHSINVKLYEDKLLVWLNEPSETIMDINLKNKIEQIVAPLLFPAFVVKFQPGLNLVERLNEPAESSRALVYHLHYGRYKRLVINDINKTHLYESKSSKLGVELMSNFVWLPREEFHMAIQATTQSGKTCFLTYLLPNLKGFSKLQVKRGAVDNGINELVIIDPKIDPHLRMESMKLNADYIFPQLGKSDYSFIDSVNSKLGEMVDLIRQRAEVLKNQPDAKFKDTWVIIDEGLAIPEMANTKGKNIYFSFLDRLLLMGASTQVHVILTGQAFNAGQIVSSYGRLQFSLRILLAPKITVENSQYLFKALDADSINNLIVDEDKFGSLGIGIIEGSDSQILPFKSPFIIGA